jgi:hypothetical protein
MLVFRTAALLGCLFLISCTGIGHLSIQEERNRYNDVIHETGVEQLLANIVRAHNFESPSFFDISEVDQTKTFQGNLQGGSSNIGAMLPLGTLTSTLTATDSPIIKYMPPSSAAYIHQVIKPIDLGSFARLVASNVPIEPLIRFSIDRLSPAYTDYFRASALISALDSFGAIRIDALSDDRIAITLIKDGILTRGAAPECLSDRPANIVVDDLWRQLTHIFNQPVTAPAIVLGHPSSKAQPGQVVALTRSALGALRIAVQNDHKDVWFAPRDQADAVRASNTTSKCFNQEFYYVDGPQGKSVEEWDKHFRFLKHQHPPLSLDELRLKMRDLGHNRALIIVEDSATRPDDAYVSISRNGHWYSISNTDKVSKKNFALLGDLLLVQAQPPSTPPTPTVISAPTTR